MSINAQKTLYYSSLAYMLYSVISKDKSEVEKLLLYASTGYVGFGWYKAIASGEL